jgi:hypothetical protein
MKTILACGLHICDYVTMKTVLAYRLHICDNVTMGSFYGITLLMMSVSETSGLNSEVPFTCVCTTLYGPLVLLPNLQGC